MKGYQHLLAGSKDRTNLDSSDLHFFFEVVEDVTGPVGGWGGLAGLDADDGAREILDAFVQIDLSAEKRHSLKRMLKIRSSRFVTHFQGPFPAVRHFLHLISTLTGFHQWGLVTRWTQLLITSNYYLLSILKDRSTMRNCGSKCKASQYHFPLPNFLPWESIAFLNVPEARFKLISMYR